MSDENEVVVRALGATLAAEIIGVDLSKPMSDPLVGALRRAFHQNMILLFRDQTLSPADQVEFTARFGPVEAHPLGSRRGLEEHPEILVLENRPGQPGARNDFWHSDISFAERPPMGSVLHAIETPAPHGDTMFCNMYAAYEELSSGLRRMLDPMTALHSAAPLAERNNQAASDALPINDIPDPMEHPVVRTHPETGRKAIFVNEYFTERFTGMTAEESRPLIEYLCARATRPENVYRHRWRNGDVLMWDNRCAMHYAVRDYDETMPRLMHRTTAAGDRPV
jgi:taurine dioxygenase